MHKNEVPSNILNMPPRPGRVRISDVLGTEAVKLIIEEETTNEAAVPQAPPLIKRKFLPVTISEIPK